MERLWLKWELGGGVEDEERLQGWAWKGKHGRFMQEAPGGGLKGWGWEGSGLHKTDLQHLCQHSE